MCSRRQGGTGVAGQGLLSRGIWVMRTISEGMRIRWIGYAILALLAFLVVHFTETHASAVDPPDKVFAFAESLFVEGDYYRAITEYKRVVFHSPHSPLVETCHFRIAESTFLARRWSEAIDLLLAYLDAYPQGAQTYRAFYLKGLAEKELKRFKDALESFEKLRGAPSRDLADRAACEQALILVAQEDDAQAQTLLQGLVPGNQAGPRSRRMDAELSDFVRLTKKSPKTAGALAAILPGAGHLYTERPRDALVAFLLNAVFIAAAVELFRNDRPFWGATVCLVELGWYLGNIYSAANAAYRYNQRQREDFLQRLDDGCQP